MIRTLAFLLLFTPAGLQAAAFSTSGAFNSLRFSAANLYLPVSVPVSAPAAVRSRADESAGARLFSASGRFLGLPYVLGPLGEGETGEFDRSPLVSFSGLDCTTFVEETIAFTLGAGQADAMDVLRRIRYLNGEISYAARNHFPETDWLPNNIAAGFIKDITVQVAGPSARSVSKVISKRAWYAAKTAADLKGFDSDSQAQQQARLARLRAIGAGLPDQEVSINYVPLAALPALLADIPSGTVVSLVREARADKPTLITHQFFIFDGPAGKIIRHAALGKQVMDVPAAEYIANLSTYTSWKVLGFNLSAVTGAR